MSNKSRGSKLGAIAGVFLTFGFFMPWLRACGTSVSGYDLATSEFVDYGPQFWGVALTGLLYIALLWFLRSENAGGRLLAGLIRLGAGVLSILPIARFLNDIDFFDYLGNSDILQAVQPGGWSVLIGYLGAGASVLIDLVAPGTTSMQAASPQTYYSPPVSSSPPEAQPRGQARFCSACGQSLPEGAGFCPACGAKVVS